MANQTREDLLQTYTTDSDKLLAAKALDKITLAEKTWEITCGDFYNPAQVQLVKNLVARRGGEAQAYFYGGYDYAERIRVCFTRDNPPSHENFGLRILYVTGNFTFFKVSHRDFLGALLSLGLRREKLGDIVVEELGAFMVVDESIADHVRISLNQVGKAPVTTDYAKLGSLQAWQPRFVSSVAIAASSRLDAMTAAVYNLSRSEAAALIAKGLVKLNHIPCLAGAKDVKAGDLISARGLGRVYVREALGKTQKDRLRIRVERFE